MTTQTPATVEIEKWLRVRFFTNFWLWVRKKNAESCRSRLRHSGSGATSDCGPLQQYICLFLLCSAWIVATCVCCPQVSLLPGTFTTVTSIRISTRFSLKCLKLSKTSSRNKIFLPCCMLLSVFQTGCSEYRQNTLSFLPITFVCSTCP